MKLTLFMVLTTVAMCWCRDGIIRNDFETPSVDGSYKWAIQTEGGIFHEQRGSFHDVDGQSALLVEGQYQYTAPDGQVINVIYRADENGFHVSSEHVPTSPPLPPTLRSLG